MGSFIQYGPLFGEGNYQDERANSFVGFSLSFYGRNGSWSNPFFAIRYDDNALV